MSQTTTFQNESIEVTAERKADCQVSMQIAIQPQLSQQAYSKALKRIKKEVSFPGFRRGKAPDEIIVERFAKALDKEWRDELKNLAAADAFKISELFPFRRDAISADFKTFSKEEISHLNLEYEVHPQLPDVELDEISLAAVESQEVTEKDIERRIESLRVFYGEWSDVEGRGVQKGDYVNLTIESLEKEPPVVYCKNQRFSCDQEVIPQWLFQAIEGLEVGQKNEALSEQDPGEEGNVEAFTPVKCSIEVNAIKSVALPPLDDAFAEKLGTQDVAHLREEVKKELAAIALREARELFRDNVDRYLLERYAFDVPHSTQEAIMREKVKEITTLLQENPEAPSQYSFPHSPEELRAVVQNEIRMRFLLNEIAKKYKVSVTKQELEREAGRMAENAHRDHDVEKHLVAAFHFLQKVKVYSLIEEIVAKKG